MWLICWRRYSPKKKINIRSCTLRFDAMAKTRGKPAHDDFSRSRPEPPQLNLAAPSKHSRAARRAPSPGLDVDKPLQQTRRRHGGAPGPASSSTTTAARGDGAASAVRSLVLAVRHAAGVQKKKKKAARGSESARARRRRERGAALAEAVGERTAAKARRSEGRLRAVKLRRRVWDDINRLAASAAADAAAAANPFDALGGGGGEEEEEDEDEDAASAGQDDDVMGADDADAPPASLQPQDHHDHEPDLKNHDQDLDDILYHSSAS